MGAALEEGADALGGISACCRSDHLGHTQVCDCQLEVALVEYLCVCFLAARGSDRVQLVLVPINRFGVVEGRRGHATTAVRLILQFAFEQARLHRIFSGGVCDYGRPGFEQQGVLDTWLIYVDVGKYKKDNGGNDDQTK